MALWGGGAVLRYSRDGQVNAIVTVPVPWPTSCTFGGPALDVLYITTAAARPRPDGAPGPGGELFACRPGTVGLPASPYRG